MYINSTGAVATPKELQDLAQVARKHKMIIMSDEIYGALSFGKPNDPLDHDRGISISSYYPEGTVIFGGISKWAGAGGWRLGSASFPPNLMWLCEVRS